MPSSIELVVAAGVLLAFVGLSVYLFQWASLSAGQQAMQASLSAEAQQVLERMLFLPSYDWSRSIGLAGLQGYLNDYAVFYYASLAASGQQCSFTQQALVNHLGTGQAYLAGWGWLVVPPSSYIDYDAVASGLWGPASGAYDFRLVIRPLVRSSCSITSGKLNFAVSQGPVGKATYVVYGVKSVGGNNFLLCAAGGYGEYQSSTISIDPGPLSCEDGSTVSLAQVDQAVMVFERVDVPYAYCVNGTRYGARPLVYGFTYYKGGYRLYLVHDSSVQCGSGNIPALGVRYIDLVWGGQRVRVANDVTLDPGQGQGSVKVDLCGSCTSNSRCAACYVPVPPQVRVAIVAVDASSNNAGYSLLAIPLMPYPPAGAVDLRSWVRWGLPYGQIPGTYSAVASRVVNGLGYTYDVTLFVYRWPYSWR